MIFSNSNTIHKCSICTGIDYIYSIRDSLSIYENMTVCLIHKSTTKIITYRNDIVFLKYNIWIWMSPNNKLHDDVKLLQNKITWSFPIKSKQGSEVKLINFPHSEITYSLVSFVKKHTAWSTFISCVWTNPLFLKLIRVGLPITNVLRFGNFIHR